MGKSSVKNVEVIMSLCDKTYDELFMHFEHNEKLYKRISDFVDAAEKEYDAFKGYTLTWYGVNWSSNTPKQLVKYLNTRAPSEYHLVIRDMQGFVLSEKGSYDGWSYWHIS